MSDPASGSDAGSGTGSEPAENAADGGRSRTAWLIRLAVSLVLATGLVLVVSRFIDLVPTDMSADTRGVAIFAATMVPFVGLRAWRWHFLLRPLGETTHRVSTLIGLAGTLWIVVLPLRLGEFARPLFVRQKTGIAASPALGVVALERVVDGLVVVALFFGTLGTASLPAGLSGAETTLDELRPWGLAAAALMGGALVVLLGMARWPSGFGRVVSTPMRIVAPPIARKFEGLSRDIAAGLAGMAPRAALPFLLITAVYWLTNWVGMWVLADAVGLPLDFVQSGAVLAVLNLSLLVPGGPAQFGNFHLGLALGLGLFVDEATVLSAGSKYVAYLFLIQLSAVAISGLYGQQRLRLDWRELFGRGRP